MQNQLTFSFRSLRISRRGLRLATAGLALLCGLLSGCAALTNPVADGVPVRRVPPEFLGLPREEEKEIPLPLLRQKPPPVYLVGPGDVLGIWVVPVLGTADQPPPVIPSTESGNQIAIGYPIPVREDGTITLPIIKPLKVEGMTLKAIEAAIKKAYREPKEIIKEDSQPQVSLIKARTSRVLVVREDSGGLVIGASGSIGSTKRGTGQVLELPAYQNDVLTALTRTGGLPGLEAMNEVVIERGSLQARADYPAVMPDMSREGSRCLAADGMGKNGQFIRIPLRMRPGEPIPFTENDILLQNGDIIYIGARDTEVFYVGGILPPGQYILPRDFDLDVVEAVTLVKGPLVNGGISQNNLSGTTVSGGVGSPSPSMLTVIRRPPGHRGEQIVIRVDLNRAMRDIRERILVQPGDILILQETPGEAVARWFTQTTRFNFFATLLRQKDLLITGNGNYP